MILTRVKISPQQRYDLEDFVAGQAASRADSKYYVQKFWSESNLVLGGFAVSGIGLTSATVNMANAALIMPQNTFDFSFFVAASGDPNITISDSSLVDNARNYVEAQLSTLDGVPLVKAFWDPEANSGAGGEFNQIVDTITDLQVTFVVSTGGFSGSADRIPIAIIDTDGSGVIKVILDRRRLFGRLATPSNIDNSYSWGTKVEPTYALTLTGVVGTFVAGETITIGSETATVTTGGSGSIAFNCPTGISFENGDSVVGGTSGATGTVNTVLESFTGVDKSLVGQKTINDALMTEIKGVKGTRFWWQDAPSLSGIKQELLSAIAPLSSGARVQWDGTKLRLTDDNNSPSTADNLAAIRMMNSALNLNLRRMDDGKEVVTITLSNIPNTGTLTLNQNGNLIPIDWNDSTSDIQTAWNGSGAFAATISGNAAAKRIVITANAAGAQVDVFASSNTLAKSGTATTPTISIKQGLASDSSIAIADGQVLYVDIPSPLASTNYSGVGSGASNYKVAARGSLSLTDAAFWLAYREGSILVWRFSGELEAGESSEISDNIPQSFLDAIGLASEASLPNYDSNIRGVAQESIVKRVGVLTDAAGDYQEDRSGYLRSDDPVVWDGASLSFTADIVLEFINTKSGTVTQHKVLTSSSPILLGNLESAYVVIDRSLATENCTLLFSGTTPIPAQVQAYKDVFILFRRVDVGADGYLHIPLHKQLVEPAQTIRLGASGGGSSTAVPPLFVRQIPSGAVDGVNDTFTLSHTPKSTDAVLVTVDSIKLIETEFSVSGTALTFNPGSIPQLGQTVEVFFMADNANSLVGVQEVPAGVVNGVNDLFTLTGTPANAEALLVFVDGVKAKETDYALTGGNVIDFVPSAIPQLGQSVDAYYVIDLDTTTVTQEVPVGAVDGVNDTFTLSGNPPYANAVLVFVDGRLVPSSTWSLLSVPSYAVKFNAGFIPQLGQSIEVYFFVVVGGGGSLATKVEYRTITAGEAAAKKLTLLFTPTVPANTIVDVLTVGAQFYADDFIVNVNELDWNGLGMDSLPIAAGDKLRIVYFV